MRFADCFYLQSHICSAPLHVAWHDSAMILTMGRYWTWDDAHHGMILTKVWYWICPLISAVTSSTSWDICRISPGGTDTCGGYLCLQEYQLQHFPFMTGRGLESKILIDWWQVAHWIHWLSSTTCLVYVRLTRSMILLSETISFTYTVQGYFRQILSPHKYLGTRRKLLNLLKITLHGICHSSVPIKATKVPKVPF